MARIAFIFTLSTMLIGIARAEPVELDRPVYHPGFFVARQGQDFYVRQILEGTLPEGLPLSPGDEVHCPTPEPSDVFPCQGRPGRKLTLQVRKAPTAALQSVEYAPVLLSLRQAYDRDTKLSSKKFSFKDAPVNYYRLWYLDESNVSGYLERELVRGGGSDAILLVDLRGLVVAEAKAVTKLFGLIQSYGKVIVLAPDSPEPSVARGLEEFAKPGKVRLALSERPRNDQVWSAAVRATALRYEPVRMHRGSGDLAVRSLLKQAE